ncbi:hypothetical protein C7S13_7477 [Burkholderia cepacia]|nr:hypothetical protein [Burkholderia cepacia]
MPHTIHASARAAQPEQPGHPRINLLRVSLRVPRLVYEFETVAVEVGYVGGVVAGAK